MEPDRWSEVEKLYHAALEREPAERMAFLNQACTVCAETRSTALPSRWPKRIWASQSPFERLVRCDTWSGV